jgi:hypothetical protein
MNYLTLINQFWTLRREVPFSSTEADLYFYLLNVSNGLNWKNPFQQANLLICATLGISEKTLIGARNRLKQYGLIDFTSGVKRAPSTYKLLLLENVLEKLQGIREECDSESDSVFDSVSGGNAPDINKHKLNKTKPTPTPAVGADSPSPSPALPAEEKKIVPPVAQPPQPVAGALSEAAALEAKGLAIVLAGFWHITEQKHFQKWAKIHRFTRQRADSDLPQLREQVQGYQAYLSVSGLSPHNLDKFLGHEAENYTDGEWNACDWQAVAKDRRARPGQGVEAAPARAATSPTKARANNWS